MAFQFAKRAMLTTYRSHAEMLSVKIFLLQREDHITALKKTEASLSHLFSQSNEPRSGMNTMLCKQADLASPLSPSGDLNTRATFRANFQRPCCKCHAVNAARGGLTCPLWMSTLSVPLSWVAPTPRRHLWTKAAVIVRRWTLYSSANLPHLLPLSSRGERSGAGRLSSRAEASSRWPSTRVPCSHRVPCSPLNATSPSFSSPARINAPHLAWVAWSHLVGLRKN